MYFNKRYWLYASISSLFLLAFSPLLLIGFLVETLGLKSNLKILSVLGDWLIVGGLYPAFFVFSFLSGNFKGR